MDALTHRPIRRLTVDETVRMVDAGIVGEDEPFELLDGLLFQMSPQGSVHAAATTFLADRLRAGYAAIAHVREEKPLTAGTYDLPEPDIAVVRGPIAAYVTRHPSGADALLVVELAWSSQDEDRRKAAVYAAAGVPTYWMLDLAMRRLEVRTAPEDGAYGVTQLLGLDDFVTPAGLDERWSVRDLLPELV